MKAKANGLHIRATHGHTITTVGDSELYRELSATDTDLPILCPYTFDMIRWSVRRWIGIIRSMLKHVRSVRGKFPVYLDLHVPLMVCPGSLPVVRP